MPRRKLEQPLFYTQLLAEFSAQDGGFIPRMPDYPAPTFIDELLDLHYPVEDVRDRGDSPHEQLQEDNEEHDRDMAKLKQELRDAH